MSCHASSYLKHIKQQQQNSGQERRDGLTNKDQKVHDTAALWYLAVLSPGVLASPGFPGRFSPSWLPVLLFHVVLFRIRGFCVSI